VLLAVFDKAPGSEYLFQVCCLVVLLSILLHGFSPTVVSRTRARKQPVIVPATPLSAHPVEAEAPDSDTTGMDYPVPGSEDGSNAEPVPAKQPLALIPLDRLRRGTLRRPVEAPDETPAKSATPVKSEPSPVVPPPSTARVDTLAPPPQAQGNLTAQTEEDENAPDSDLGPRTSQQFITLAGVKHLWQKGEKVVILDVRTERTYDMDHVQAAGAVRINPMYSVKQAEEKGLSKQDWLIAYCA